MKILWLFIDPPVTLNPYDFIASVGQWKRIFIHVFILVLFCPYDQ